MRSLAIAFLLFSSACSIKSGEHKFGYLYDVQIFLDTLLIDAGNEIIYTNNSITGSDISTNKKYLYNFNDIDHTLEVINLDKLKLERKIHFEKEGPNGTGDIVNFISVIDEDHIVLKGMNKSDIFNLKGEKIKTIEYKNYSLGREKGEEVRLASPLINPDFDQLYLLILKQIEKGYALGILDFENHKTKLIPLDSFNGFKDYTMSVTISGGTIKTPNGVYLRMFDNKLVLSSQVDNEFLIYSLIENKLITKSNKSQLYAEKKVKNYRFDHDSFQSKDEEYKNFHQEINFLPPFWDEKNHVYFRLSYEEIHSDLEDDEFIKTKTYLTALDENYNLIGEMVIPQLNKLPLNGSYRQFPKHFTKNGKIWIYENINDEMGFVVLTIAKENLY